MLLVLYNYNKTMKSYFSIVVFVVLLSSSVITGTDRYLNTENIIKLDLNQALAHAIAEKGGAWFATDTIKAYRRLRNTASGHVALLINDECFNERLSIPELRDKAYISFDILAKNIVAHKSGHKLNGVCSDTVILNPASLKYCNASVVMRGYAECSFLMVLSMSDQKLPITLMLLSLIWAGVANFYIRGRRKVELSYCNLPFNKTVGSDSVDVDDKTGKFCMVSVGNMSYDMQLETFYGADKREINLTPMQFELMKMFFKAEGHRLVKADICNALWPGKDNANETLYTMIKRLKHVVEANSNLKIEVERGRAYKLRIDA